MSRIQEQPHADEFARPQPMRRVGKLRLELDRAGGLQDLVVDQRELALVQLDLAVLAVGENRERSFGLQLLLLDLRQVGLRQREDHRDRLDLRGDHEPVGIGRMDDVADIDLTDADDAVDRRSQPRVAELNVGGIDERLIGFDGVLQLRHLRLLGVQQLRRGIARLRQRGVAVEIGQRIRQLRLIAVSVRRQLFDLGLIGTRIDLRQQIAGMDGLAFGEIDADELALNLAAHDNRIVSDDGADAGQIDRHVVLSDCAGDDRHRRRVGAAELFDVRFAVRDANAAPPARTTASRTVAMMRFRRMADPPVCAFSRRPSRRCCRRSAKWAQLNGHGVGLTPALPSSVEPSGIVPMPSGALRAGDECAARLTKCRGCLNWTPDYMCSPKRRWLCPLPSATCPWQCQGHRHRIVRSHCSRGAPTTAEQIVNPDPNVLGRCRAQSGRRQLGCAQGHSGGSDRAGGAELMPNGEVTPIPGIGLPIPATCAKTGVQPRSVARKRRSVRDAW